MREMDMIRNIAVYTWKADTTQEQIDGLERALKALKIPGVTNIHMSRDLGLRPGNLGGALTCDIADAETYKVWDANEEHNRIRRELAAPIAEKVERVQIRLD